MNKQQEPDNARRTRWEKQIAPYRSGIYNLFIRRGVPPHEAEDLTQETLLRMYRYFDRIRIPQVAGAYVWRVASSIMADYLDKKRKHREINGLNGWTDEDDSDFIDNMRLLPVFGNGPEDPQETLQRKEEQNALRAALQELSARDRTILSLHYLQGSSYAEIAAILDMKEEAVNVAACRARARLRKQIDTKNAYQSGVTDTHSQRVDSLR